MVTPQQVAPSLITTKRSISHEHRADTTIEIQPIYGWGRKKNNKDTDKERDKRVNRMKKK